jgi:hypothetical protein
VFQVVSASADCVVAPLCPQKLQHCPGPLLALLPLQLLQQNLRPLCTVSESPLARAIAANNFAAAATSPVASAAAASYATDTHTISAIMIPNAAAAMVDSAAAPVLRLFNFVEQHLPATLGWRGQGQTDTKSGQWSLLGQDLVTRSLLV